MLAHTDRRAIIGLLALFVSVPFLNPIHHLPIPSFYEEWWAFFLGTSVAFSVTIFRPLRLTIPELAALPGFLLLMIIGQWLTGMIVYHEAVLLHGGYLAWGGLLLILGATLNKRLGTTSMFGALATAVLAGSLISAVLGIMQFTHFPLSTNIKFPPVTGSITANIAQPNLLASYLWIGIAAAVYLVAQRRLSLRAAIPAVVALGFTAGLSGSRIAVLHGFLLLGIGLAIRKLSQPGQIRHRNLLVLCGLISLAMGTLALSHWPVQSAPSGTFLDRFSPKLISGDARIVLWRGTATMISDHPWVGNGVGNFPWRMVESAAKAQPGASTMPGAEHAHNALLQVAADFGLPVLAVCLFLLLRWVRRIKPDETGADQWAIDLLAILGLHSMLEYPLWDAQFLGLAALAAGALAVQPKIIDFPASSNLLRIGMAGALLALIPLRLDYGALDEATNYPPQLHPSDSDWRRRIKVVAHLATHSGLGAYANIALGALLEPDKKLAAEQSLVCERAMRIWPDPTIIARCAVLRLLAGKEQEGDELMTIVTHAFRSSEQRQAIADVLGRAEKKNPEVHRLGVLWRQQD